MYSVVIPTMLMADTVYKTIVTLSMVDSVGEVILIDNSGGEGRFGVDKLVHVTEGRNTFVNPAWNKGVSMARHDKVCLLNDDVQFDWSFLGTLEGLLGPDVGFVGMHPENMTGQRSQTFFKDGFTLVRPEPDGKTRAGHRPEHWGTCICFDRSIWDPIPGDMLIWGGDDWLFYRSKRPNYCVHGLNVWGDKSATISSLDVSGILRSDMLSMAEHVRRGEVENYLLGTIWWP